jgi:hypothetical protein
MVIMRASSYAVGLFLNSHLLIAVTHMLEGFSGILEIHHHGQVQKIPQHSWKVISRSSTKELSLVMVEGVTKKNITSYLPYRIPRKTVIAPAQVVSLTKLNGAIGRIFTPGTVVTESKRPMEVWENQDISSLAGDCGSVYYTFINTATPVIFGMHLAGKEGEKRVAVTPLSWEIFGSFEAAKAILATPLKTEFAKNGLAQGKDFPYRPFSEHGIDAYHKNSYMHWALSNDKFCHENARPVGTIGYTTGGKWKSSLKASRLQGLAGLPMSEKQPPVWRTVKRNGEDFSPPRLAHESLTQCLGHYNFPGLKLAMEVVQARHARILSKYAKLWPLTEHSSLNGLSGVRYVDKFKENTGAGLPFKGPKTDRLLQGTPENLMYTKAGRDSVLFITEQLMAGVNPGIIFDINFKDEIKKPLKDIRTFTACPAVYNELARRISLLPSKLLQDNYLLSGISIGVDVRSAQWGHIGRKHQRFPHHWFCDFQKYDRSHHWKVLQAACQVCLSDAAQVYAADATVEGYPVLLLYARILAVLLRPTYAYKDSLFEVDGTLASGVFITAMLNSIVQEIILQCAWIGYKGTDVIAKEFHEGVDSFQENNASDKLGDDGMVSTFEKGFNLPFFAGFCARELGIVVTSPTKDDILPLAFPESTWNFLKRGFNFQPDGVFAPIEMESILKNVNWQRPGPETEEALHFSFVTSALQDCAATGDDRYQELYCRIVEAFELVWPDTRDFPSYEEEVQRQKNNVKTEKDSPGALWVRAAEDPVSFYMRFWKVRAK